MLIHSSLLQVGNMKEMAIQWIIRRVLLLLFNMVICLFLSLYVDKNDIKKYFPLFLHLWETTLKTLIAAKHEDMMHDAGCDGPKEGMMEGQT